MDNSIVLELEARDRVTPELRRLAKTVDQTLMKVSLAHKTFAEESKASLKANETLLLKSLNSFRRALMPVRAALEDTLRPIQALNQELGTINQKLGTMRTRMSGMSEGYLNPSGSVQSRHPSRSVERGRSDVETQNRHQCDTLGSAFPVVDAVSTYRMVGNYT